MRVRGFAAVVAAASCWGIAGVVAKSLFNRSVTPGAVVEIRMTAGALLVLGILWAQGRTARLPWKTVRSLVPLGVAMAAAQSMYYLTISLANVTTAIFLQYTAPTLVVTYTALIHREPISVRQVACLLAALAGGYLLLVGPTGLTVTPLVVITGTASALGFAAWTILGRARAAQVGPWEMLLYALATGGVIWSVFVPPWRAYGQPYAPAEWGLITFIVVFATVLPLALFLYGLRFLDSRTASLTATIEPVVATAAAAALLGEGFTPRELLGALLILASVLLLQITPGRR